MILQNKSSYPVPFHPTWEILDSTKVQAYQDCPRMFFYEYVLGWRSDRPNNHLHFGSCLHEAMEHLKIHGYGIDAITEAVTLFNAQYREVFPADTDALFFPKTPARFLSMMMEYVKKYHDDFQKYEILHTEIAGIVPLSPQHQLHFKMDTVIKELATQTYGSLEHKSKGGYISPGYRSEFMNAVQVGTYTHVLNCLFPRAEVKGVTINCLCFKKVKGTKAGTALFELERIPVFLSNDQMQVWLTNTCIWLDLIEDNYKLLSICTPDDRVMPAFPLNGRSCTNWNRLCTYYDYCVSWPNPLKRCEAPPIGLEIDFWDPSAQPARETFDFTKGD